MNPETPQEVYENNGGKTDVFVYKVDEDGEVLKAKVITRGRSGWDNIQFPDGTRINIQRRDRWAPCPLEACEVELEDACQEFVSSYDRRPRAFERLKKAVQRMEEFNPETLVDPSVGK